jgi:hypothetical protein
MSIFTTHTVPRSLDEITNADKRQLLLRKIAQFPGIFALEMIGISLLILGTYVAGEWAFNIGFTLTASM